MPRASQAGKGRLRSISPHPREESCVRPLKKKKKKKENRQTIKPNAWRIDYDRGWTLADSPLFAYFPSIRSDRSILSSSLTFLPFFPTPSRHPSSLWSRVIRSSISNSARAMNVINKAGQGCYSTFKESGRAISFNEAVVSRNRVAEMIFTPRRERRRLSNPFVQWLLALSSSTPTGVGCCLPTAILFFQAKRNLCWRRGTKEDGEDTEGAKGQERRGSAIERLKGEKTKELWGREVTRRTRARLREKWKRGAGAKRGSLCFSLNREMRQEEGSKPWIFVGCGSGKSPGGCTIREGLAGASLARASARGWRAPRA